MMRRLDPDTGIAIDVDADIDGHVDVELTP